MNLKLFIFAVSILLIAGCATTEYRALPEVPVKKEPVKPQGIYHKVEKSETLFRIAKSYGVSVEDVIVANNIPNGASLEVGQLLLIPGAKEARQIPTTRTPDENKEEFIWPLKGKVISYFKDHHGEGLNKGIDIEASDGDTVKAVREGDVVLADYMSEYHDTIMIDHGDGLISVYAKNYKLLVKLGDHVLKGDPIAQIGTESGKSFLHFEIRKGKEATNPLYYLP